MAKFMVLSDTFVRPHGHASARMFKAGETINFDGAPGLVLAPLDEQALAAQRAHDLERYGADGWAAAKTSDRRALANYMRRLPASARLELEQFRAGAGAAGRTQ